MAFFSKLFSDRYRPVAPTSLVEDVDIRLDKHPQLPGMLRVEIKIVAVVSPYILRKELYDLKYRVYQLINQPKARFEQFLRMALPYTNPENSLSRVIEFTNRVIAQNKPEGPGNSKV